MDAEIKKHVSNPDVPRPSNEELVRMCSGIVDAIEKCGASPELTAAVIKASDLWHCLRKPETPIALPSDDDLLAAFNSADSVIDGLHEVIALASDRRTPESETDHLLSNPANAAHIARSIEQARNGQVQERQLVEVENAQPRGGDVGAGLFKRNASGVWEQMPRGMMGCDGVVILYHAKGWPGNVTTERAEGGGA